MITVVYTEHNQQISELTIKGHANSGPHGHDLVCAAVSAVSIGALNALSHKEDYRIVIEDGYVDVKLLNQGTDHDAIVLQTLLISLQTIEETAPKSLKITLKKGRNNHDV